jgi:hypothetical protein
MRMSAISYSDVFELEHETSEAEPIVAGDVVRAGLNLFPHFDVVAVHGDMAWVRNVQSGLNALMPLARCRKLTPA